MTNLLDRGRPSLTALLCLAVVLVGGLGTLRLQLHGSAHVRVVVLTHRVPAFHVLAATDVKLADVARADVPRDAIRSLDQVIDRFTVTNLGSDAAIGKDDLGPAAPCCAKLFVLPLTVDDPAAAHLQRGDLVDLALAPSEKGKPPVIVPGVLVVDLAEPTEGTTTLNVAIPEDRIRDVAMLIARSEPLLLAPSH